MVIGKIKTSAEMAAFTRAAGALDRAASNPDTIARRLLRARFHVALLPGLRHVLRRRYERSVPGLQMFIHARTWQMDAIVRERLAGGTKQLVILGAGLDSRAYRFRDELRGVRVFEVDHPATSAWKRQLLERANLSSDHVQFVPLDFTSETLVSRLPDAGFDSNVETLFLWEGVTMYLPERAISETLAFVGSTARGSAIVFDYFFREAVEHPERFHGARECFAVMGRSDEPLEFGVDPSELELLLRRHGLRLAKTYEPGQLARFIRLGRTRTMIDFGAIALAEVPPG